MHHEAHTFRSQTLPRMSSAEKFFDGCFNCGSLNVGAALLISGEGTSCGSRPRPIARKATRTRNMPSGIKYLSITNFFCVFLCAFAPLRETNPLPQRRKGARKFLRFRLHRSSN